MVGMIPLFAWKCSRRSVIDQLPGFEADGLVPRAPPDLARHIAYCEAQRPPAASGASRLAAGDPVAGAADARAAIHARRERVPLAATACARCRQTHREQPYDLHVDGQELEVQLRARRIEHAACSAATPTGAGRSGFRSTTCSSRRWSAITTSTATRCKVECPTGSGSELNLSEVATRDLQRRLARLFLPDATASRAGHGDDRSYAADPHWQEPVLFPRILPRRHRPRPRRQPPDRLDGAGRAAAGKTGPRTARTSPG